MNTTDDLWVKSLLPYLFCKLREMKKEKSEYKIVRNEYTNGLSCYFDIEGNWYFADLSYCRDVRANEMMIFRANENKEVVNRGDVYCRNFDSISKENVIAGIEDFKQNYWQSDL